MRIIELTEYGEPQSIPPQVSSESTIESIIERLEKDYKNQIKLNIKRTKQGYEIELKAKGWVGFIPLNSDLAIKINPKVSIANLFGMLNYALNLESFEFLDGVAHSSNIIALCDRLAQFLIKNIMKRLKKGLYSEYIYQENALRVIRGKINLKKNINQPYNLKLNCQYHHHTNDIEDNQILLWTLRYLSRATLLNKQVHSDIRKVYHALQNSISLQEIKAQDCLNRKYNRLNQDYETMHKICYLFLNYLIPSHHQGEETALPFLVNMAQLYQQFVAQWLKHHLPSQLELKIQETVKLKKDLNFQIDLVIYNSLNQKACYVLDTKYKTELKNADIYQIISYATQKQCKNAILIYPKLIEPLTVTVGEITIRSLNFSLDENLEIAGKNFLNNLLNTRVII